jgi:hypothetical protein
MNREQGSMYFNLTDNEFQAVCEISNKEDISLGQALAMLIVKGLESVREQEEESLINLTESPKNK